MAFRGENRVFFDLGNTGVNRSDSPRHLAPGEAVIVQNFDFNREGKGLVGRRGTLTLNDANPLTGEGYDLHWTYDPTNDRQYIVCVQDDGADFRIGAWEIGVSVAFTDLTLHGGGNFRLTRNVRVSFVTAYNATLGRTVMYGTNGTEQPFYWDFTQWNGIWQGAGAPQAPAGSATAEMQFGTVDFRLHHFCPVPWRGLTWAFSRQDELVTIHWPDSDDGRLFVDQGNAGFIQAPQDDFKNPLRGLYPIGDKMMVFNIDSIGSIVWTNNPDDPYEYRLLTRGAGAIHQQCIAPWGNNLIFIDKREPYLMMTNGSQVIPLDPERKIVTAIQEYVDWSDILLTRLRVGNNVAYLSFETRNNADAGVDGTRWTAAISLTRKGPRGNPYFPWGFSNLHSNDILVADEGTNVGYVWYSDAQADPTDGKYYIRRLAAFYDGANQYGDYNRVVVGPDPVQPIAYILQTGYWNGDDPSWKEFMTFTLDGDWEGTPAAGDVLRIRYRCEGWDGWSDLLVSNVRKFGEIPFALTAQGREIQFKFEFTSATAIPKIYGYGFTYKAKRVRI